MTINLKWIVVGQSAYPVCPYCGAYPLFLYGLDEYHNYMLQCKRCGILVARKTPPSKLKQKAVRRFWGGQIANKAKVLLTLTILFSFSLTLFIISIHF